jgi:hypothetical protein
MDKLMFSIFDNVSELYEPPFVEINKGTAMRRITDLMKTNPQSPYAKFPDNYTLVMVGSWDENGGIPLNNKHPETVVELVQLLEPKDMEK